MSVSKFIKKKLVVKTKKDKDIWFSNFLNTIKLKTEDDSNVTSILKLRTIKTIYDNYIFIINKKIMPEAYKQKAAREFVELMIIICEKDPIYSISEKETIIKTLKRVLITYDKPNLINKKKASNKMSKNDYIEIKNILHNSTAEILINLHHSRVMGNTEAVLYRTEKKDIKSLGINWITYSLDSGHTLDELNYESKVNQRKIGEVNYRNSDFFALFKKPNEDYLNYIPIKAISKIEYDLKLFNNLKCGKEIKQFVKNENIKHNKKFNEKIIDDCIYIEIKVKARSFSNANQISYNNKIWPIIAIHSLNSADLMPVNDFIPTIVLNSRPFAKVTKLHLSSFGFKRYKKDYTNIKNHMRLLSGKKSDLINCVIDSLEVQTHPRFIRRSKLAQTAWHNFDYSTKFILSEMKGNDKFKTNSCIASKMLFKNSRDKRTLKLDLFYLSTIVRFERNSNIHSKFKYRPLKQLYAEKLILISNDINKIHIENINSMEMPNKINISDYFIKFYINK